MNHSARWLLIGLLLSCRDAAPPTHPLTLPTAAQPDAAAAPPTAAPPADAGPLTAAAKASIDDYFRERRRLDETLWANEELAQAHEAYFVALWDALRGGEDPVERLSRDVEVVALPELSSPASIAPGITMRAGPNPSRELGPDEWKAALVSWRQAGYTLVQSEWHHRRFEPGPNGRRSRVKAELHLMRRTPQSRLVVRATLNVHWREGTPPTPRRVEVRELVVLERSGDVMFDTAATFRMGPNKPSPILAHDLDHDGTVEFLLPTINQRHRLERGLFAIERLVSHPLPNTSAAVLADFTGDGAEDLMVAAKPEGEVVLFLYKGTAKGEFPDHPTVVFAAKEPLELVRVIAPGDVDGDGDLDVWVTQYRGAYNRGRMPTPFYDANDGWPSYFLRNQGGGRFTEETEKVGLTSRQRRHTQSASFYDFDRDGDVDLLTVNDFAGVDFHRNDGGRFTLATREWVDNPTLFGMSHVLSDLDGDGVLDLFATGMNSTTVRRLNDLGLDRPDVEEDVRWRTEMTFGNRFYRGLGGGKFALAPAAKQVAASGWSWGTASADWDRDGDRDLFIANGFISGNTAKDYCTQYWRHDVYLDDEVSAEAGDELMGSLIGVVESGISWNGFEHDRLFLNTDSGFHEVGFLLGSGAELDGRNAIATDYDGDGAVDLVVAQGTRKGKLVVNVMRNVAKPAGHWIGVRLQGAPGVSPIGARVVAETAGGAQVAAVVAGDSFLSQHPTMAHFGLGSTRRVESIRVEWPGGRTSVLRAPAIDRYHVVKASGAKPGR